MQHVNFKKGEKCDVCIQTKYMLHLPGYLFPNPSGRERDWKQKEREKGRKHGWRLFGLCPLCTGLTGAKLRLSAPASLSFTQADKYAHTLTAGVTSYIRQHKGRAKHTLSQNHAFINTFTHSELLHITEWHRGERSDSLKCCIKGTAITNTESL